MSKFSVRIACDDDKCIACRSCELACRVEHSQSKRLTDALSERPAPPQRIALMLKKDKPHCSACRHCKNAPCIRACPEDALYKDEETGLTRLDPEKCVSCWKCVAACPFDAMHKDLARKLPVMCDLCPDRDDYACVAACPTSALSPTERSRPRAARTAKTQ